MRMLSLMNLFLSSLARVDSYLFHVRLEFLLEEIRPIVLDTVLGHLRGIPHVTFDSLSRIFAVFRD